MFVARVSFANILSQPQEDSQLSQDSQSSRSNPFKVCVEVAELVLGVDKVTELTLGVDEVTELILGVDKVTELILRVDKVTELILGWIKYS